MTLIPWRSKQREGVPAESSPLAALRSEMDRLFDSFIREPFGMLDWPALMGGEHGGQPSTWPSRTRKLLYSSKCRASMRRIWT